MYFSPRGLQTPSCRAGPKPEDADRLLGIYGEQPPWHGAIPKILLSAIDLNRHAQDEKARSAAEDELKRQFLHALDVEIKLQIGREHLAEIGSGLILQEPPGSALETLLRYRAANIREYKDSLDSLLRIRRLRHNQH